MAHLVDYIINNLELNSNKSVSQQKVTLVWLKYLTMQSHDLNTYQ